MARAAGRVASAVLLAVTASSARADVFRCVDGGRVSYQDAPCKTPGRTLDVSAAKLPPGAAERANDEFARLKAAAAAQDSERQSAARTAEADAARRELDGYDRAEAAELAPLRAKLADITANYAGAPWERARAESAVREAMQAVTDRYAAMRQAARPRGATSERKPAGTSPPAAAR
jgi:hypothetical protein